MLVAGSPVSIEHSILSKLQLLGCYLPSKVDLFKVLHLDANLISTTLADTFVPNAMLLHAYGMAEHDIGRALLAMPWLLTHKAASFKEFVDCAVDVGFPSGTYKFLRALEVLSRFTKKALLSKVEFFKSLGWSETEFNAAFLEALFCMFADDPLLLMFSLEKRLVLQYRVHQILKAEGLHGSSHLFSSIVRYTDKQFLKQYVILHLDTAPVLGKIYPAACPTKA